MLVTLSLRLCVLTFTKVHEIQVMTERTRSLGVVEVSFLCRVNVYGKFHKASLPMHQKFFSGPQKQMG